MAKTPEAKVKDSIKKLLVKHDVYYFMPATGGFGKSGVPDFVCCFKSKFLAIEAKAGGGKTTALQDREINAIRMHGGHAMVVNEDNLETLEFLIKALEN
jgi:Holliday junction resolvase